MSRDPSLIPGELHTSEVPLAGLAPISEDEYLHNDAHRAGHLALAAQRPSR